MTDTIYGVVGEPRAADHLVVGRSSATVCGKTIGATWLLARGIYTAETFIGSRGACEACSNAVHPPARDGETLSAASVPPKPPTLKEKVRAMFDFLDMAPEAIRECHAALSSICETLGLDYRSTEISDIPAAVAALRAEVAALRAKCDALDDALAEETERPRAARSASGEDRTDK